QSAATRARKGHHGSRRPSGSGPAATAFANHAGNRSWKESYPSAISLQNITGERDKALCLRSHRRQGRTRICDQLCRIGSTFVNSEQAREGDLTLLGVLPHA